jgi:hypothetical protein
MQFHPLADILPLIEGAEFQALVDDIREYGLNEPIVTYQGQVLDGRNRWRACQEIGTDKAKRFRTVEYEGNDPVAFVAPAPRQRAAGEGAGEVTERPGAAATAQAQETKMKTVHMTDHMTFPIRGPEGEFEVDVFYSDDWRVTEICIAGENE